MTAWGLGIRRLVRRIGYGFLSSDEQTTGEPISIGEETVAEKANDLAVCKCIA